MTARIRDFVAEVEKHVQEMKVRYQGKYMYYIDQVDNTRLWEDTGFRLKYGIPDGAREHVVRQITLNEEKRESHEPLSDSLVDGTFIKR